MYALDEKGMSTLLNNLVKKIDDTYARKDSTDLPEDAEEITESEVRDMWSSL